MTPSRKTSPVANAAAAKLASSARRGAEEFVAPAGGLPSSPPKTPSALSGEGGRTWSTFQRAIFDLVEDPDGGNAIVKAVAGSGKTTTIVECFRRLRGHTSIFLAFNKAIATELQTRGVNARTFHSLCYSPVTKFKNARTVEPNKLMKVQDQFMSREQTKLYGAFTRRLVGLARQVGIGAGLVEDTEQAWYDIIEWHDLELDSERASMSEAVELARILLRRANSSPLIDFDDLLYLAVKEGLPLPKFSFVFVDEAQDTNAIQRAILRKILAPNARIVAVGDPAQAIYGFRGADSESLAQIGSEFRCRTLPLSVSYRCARQIVEYARQWVADIEPSDEAPEGVTVDLDTRWEPSAFAAGDMVVCRTTKPLISLGFRLLKERKPVRILGREIGDGLVALIRRMEANDLPTLERRLIEWRTRETEKALAKQDEAKAEAIADKADALLVMIDGLAESERSVDRLIGIIQQLFAERADATVLATIHKAKGLEAEKVYWLNSSQCPARWARQSWQKQQERNLCYVATTRAKSMLVFIEEPK